jgi:hypothetical protein
VVSELQVLLHDSIYEPTLGKGFNCMVVVLHVVSDLDVSLAPPLGYLLLEDLIMLFSMR